jgi:hypothetical protein
MSFTAARGTLDDREAFREDGTQSTKLRRVQVARRLRRPSLEDVDLVIALVSVIAQNVCQVDRWVLLDVVRW